MFYVCLCCVLVGFGWLFVCSWCLWFLFCLEFLIGVVCWVEFFFRGGRFCGVLCVLWLFFVVFCGFWWVGLVGFGLVCLGWFFLFFFFLWGWCGVGVFCFCFFFIVLGLCLVCLVWWIVGVCFFVVCCGCFGFVFGLLLEGFVGIGGGFFVCEVVLWC